MDSTLLLPGCVRSPPALTRASGPGRAVVDRPARGRVDLLGREQHHRLHIHGAGRVRGQGHGGGGLVVGQLADHVGVAVPKGEVERLESPAHALGHLSDRLAPGAAAGGPNPLQAVRRVRRLEQELGHGVLLGGLDQPSHRARFEASASAWRSPAGGTPGTFWARTWGSCGAAWRRSAAATSTPSWRITAPIPSGEPLPTSRTRRPTAAMKAYAASPPRSPKPGRAGSTTS